MKASWVTSGPLASVALHGQALVVVPDPHHAALLRTRRLRGAAGQDDPDLPPVHVQVSALPHVHILTSDWLKVPPAGSHHSKGSLAEGYVSVEQRKWELDLPVDGGVSTEVLLGER